MSQPLIDLLVRENFVSPAQLPALNDVMTAAPDLILPRCISQGIFEEAKLLTFLAQRFSLQTVDLSTVQIADDVVALFPLAVLEKLQALPLSHTNSTVVVALADPTLIPAITEKISATLRKNTEIVLTGVTALQAHLRRPPPTLSGPPIPAPPPPKVTPSAPPPQAVARKPAPRHTLPTSIPENADAVATLNSIFSEAIRLRASDIHIEPTKTAIRVRVRIDGNMFDVKELPSALKETLPARAKVLARLDTAEKRMPQDGKIRTSVNNRELDFRCKHLADDLWRGHGLARHSSRQRQSVICQSWPVAHPRKGYSQGH